MIEQACVVLILAPVLLMIGVILLKAVAEFVQFLAENLLLVVGFAIPVLFFSLLIAANH